MKRLFVGLAAVALVVLAPVAATPSHAFNPQPDPPGVQQTGAQTYVNVTVLGDGSVRTFSGR